MMAADAVKQSMKKALIIFVRKPEKGKVKTRLAATVGEDAALYIYQKLLKHTAAVAKSTGIDTFVFYAGEIEEDDLWNEISSFKRKQKETDLGGRMKAAFAEVFENGYSHVVIIGSDCPHLSVQHIQEAFHALQNNDVVIGPASDGGYYLLGMKNVHASLFENIAWSTNTVYQRTIHILEGNSLSFFPLPVLTDVDEANDLPEEWKTELRQLNGNQLT